MKMKHYDHEIKGAALVITLVLIVLMTTVVLGYLSSVTWETGTAANTLQQQKARAMAVTAMNDGLGRLREALGKWDNPFEEFAVNPPDYFWSISPGLLTKWKYTAETYADLPVENKVALFSQSANPTSTDPVENPLVDLNRKTSDGKFPIIGGTNPPKLSVMWVNVLDNPAVAAGPDNQIVGRYAFWIDDECAKVNLNTADGTDKYTPLSLGQGSPAEVSLAEIAGLQESSEPAARTLAKEVVEKARTTGFTSPRSVLKDTPLTEATIQSANDSITVWSRSPELNVFGQPRVSMTPILGTSDFESTDMLINSITLQPVQEIYPTPFQLSPYRVGTITNLAGGDGNGGNTYVITPTDPHRWPLAFRAGDPLRNFGADTDMKQTWMLGRDNFWYGTGLLLANYLGGTDPNEPTRKTRTGVNAAGRAIAWPAFPSATGAFKEKYTLRQIDSLVAQITSLGTLSISPDTPWVRKSGGNWQVTADKDMLEHIGRRSGQASLVVSGWLSKSWVNGIGRGFKVSRVLTKAQTVGPESGPPTSTNWAYKPPRLKLDFFVDLWLPAGFLGGKDNTDTGVLMPSVGGGTFLGSRSFAGCLNGADLSYGPFAQSRALIPMADGSASHWANQLLKLSASDSTDVVADFAGNSKSSRDPIGAAGGSLPAKLNPERCPANDQVNFSALDRRNPDGSDLDPDGNFTWQSYSGRSVTYAYCGAAYPEAAETYYGYTTPLKTAAVQSLLEDTNDWRNGRVRCIPSLYGGLYPVSLSTNSPGKTIQIRGGVTVLSQMFAGGATDPDPTPLEAIRGGEAGDPKQNITISEENYTKQAVEGGSGETVRQRALKAVIPVEIDIPVPSSAIGAGEVRYSWARVQDPLVNKFPKDWIVDANQLTGPPGMRFFDAETTRKYFEYDELGASLLTAGRTTADPLVDPDSYWLPQADCGFSNYSDVKKQTLIPRSARFPSLGYLQYVRTGIMPDKSLDASPYESQKGTPFRLFSYAPSGEQTTQGGQSYPDWAILDLVYVPSILAPYGSRWNPSNIDPCSASSKGEVARLATYGTFGGSTAGRVNPNGVVAYTTSVDVPDANISRTLPLKSVFHGVKLGQSVVGTGATASWADDADTTTADATLLANAIAEHIRNQGPLRMPGEICNVEAIANLRPSVNRTRNDLVRQTVGTLTTQSNVFSIWVAGQSIKKIRNNTAFGRFEPGDRVLAETRYRFVVERYLDPGTDGIYGNTVNRGPDNEVGSFDDPMDSSVHPDKPKYLYRVLHSEEVL